MSIQEKIKGKDLKRVLPQWKRQVRIQKQRMRAYLVGAMLMLAVAVGAFFFSFIPRWLQIGSFVILPFQVLGFVGDRHIYLARKADVAELEQLIEQSSNDR
ncbi:hypothetical protein LCGC14_2822930 [marine sediment metagenome]|uniref:Uncharacterized protein n=1 Tax=marine sediment metagenome TaxID=412755 RepID=A0A0F8YG94_9ZZZZ